MKHKKVNSLAKHILTEILKDPCHWYWAGAKTASKLLGPNTGTIYNQYLRAWEYYWMEEIYIPMYYRACCLLKALVPPEFAEEHFCIVVVDGVERVGIEWDDYAYDLQLKLDHYTKWWLWKHHNEWGQLPESYFTDENLMALNVQPKRQLTLGGLL